MYCIVLYCLYLFKVGNSTDIVYLRPAGGDPEIDRQQKYFFDCLCFFEWTWPFWTPLKAFREEAVWFKQRKTRRKVAPFLTPLGAARAARSADWLKIDMWENPSFESSGSRQLVGTLRCALPYSPLTCTSTHFRSSLACLSSACISLGMLLEAKFTPAVSSVRSLTPPPPPLSLSLSPACDQIREKESLLLNTTIRASKRKFAKCGGPGLQGSHSQHAVADSKEKKCRAFSCNVKLCSWCFVNFERPQTRSCLGQLLVVHAEWCNF